MIHLECLNHIFWKKIIHSKMASDVADLVIKSIEIGDRLLSPN